MGKVIIAAIETGGTKLLARACDLESGETVAQQRWSTGTAEEAAADLGTFLAALPSRGRLAAVGMAAFGPVVVDPLDPGYGQLLATTKTGWMGSNLRLALERRLGVPVALETDVSAAAIAEQAIGSGRGMASLAYVTVGTGIGAGLAIRGESLKGALHPEFGHLRLVRLEGDTMPSICPFHPDCAEGLVSGPAIGRRLGEGRDFGSDPATVELVAAYLGQLAAAMVLAWSPHRIVWGGGIIEAAPQLPGLIHARLRQSLGGYGVGPAAEQEQFCAMASLENSGLEGALVIARRLAGEDRPQAG